MDRESIVYKLNRHNRDRRRERLVTGLFYVTNAIVLTTVWLGIDAVTQQGCAEDRLCTMTPAMRTQIRSQREDDDRLANIALLAGGALALGDIAYYFRNRR